MIMKKKLVLNIVLAFAVLLMVIPAAGCDTKYTPSEADKKVTQGLPSEFLMLGQAWQLPLALKRNLFHLWTPLFAEYGDISDAVACASLSLGFDPPHHMEDIAKWLALRVHTKLHQNLEACNALQILPDVLESDKYSREMAVVAE